MPRLKFLSGGGQMGERIRAHDWSLTPLGSPETWSASLRSAASICLNSSLPTAIYWGPDLRLLYNDAWVPIPAERHPWALAQPAAEVWADIWPIVGPQFERVLTTGEGFSAFDQMLPMERSGRVHETYWNYSFTPIRDDEGAVVGILNQGNETTDRVLSQRRQAFKLKLEEELRHQNDPRAIMSTAVEELGRHLGANRVGYGEVQPDDKTVVLDVCWAEGVQPLSGSYRLDSFGPEDIARQRQGRTQSCNDILEDPGQDPGVWTAISTRAYASVPLIRNRRFTASLYVNFREPHRWTAEEIALMEDVGTRTWEAVERARAEAALRASEARLRFLGELDEALRRSSDAPAAMRAAAELLARRLGACRCAYAAVDADHDSFVIHDDYAAPGFASSAGSYNLDLFGPRAAADMRGGRTLVIRNVPGELMPGDGREVFQAIAIEAIVCCPLVKSGRLAAMMAVHQDRPRDWTSDEVALVETVVERCWAHVERVGAEVRLRESETRFRNLADHAPVMMWVTDASGFCTYLNRLWYAFTGQTPAAAEGFGWLDATHPEDRLKAEQVFLQANAARRAFRLEYRLRRHDGVYRWAIDAAAPRFSPSGDFLGYVGSVIDIDERREVEERLRISEERLRIATEAAGIGTFDFDPLTGALLWDERCKAAFGLPSSAEVTYDTFLAGLHPDDREPIDTEVRRALAPEGPGGYSVEYRTVGLEDAVERWVGARGQAIFDSDGPNRRAVRFVGTVLDITAARRASEMLERRVEERTAELEAANRQLMEQIEERERIEATLHQMQRLEAVGQLTSGVAHDFNNLLTVVLGNIGFVERAIARNQIDGKVTDRLGYMRMAAERGATLISQLLAFSRRQRLEAKPIDLNETVSGMRDLLQSSMGGSVRLETVLTPGVWPALVDPTQIELVILNLAINARDAMEVGGSLTVRTGNVNLAPPQRPEEPPAGDYVMVAVSDTGTGMTEDVRTKAFEPFLTTKETGKGSGLGLAQIYGFAKQSGGGVQIETKLGEGTTVKVFLPRAEGQEAFRPEIGHGTEGTVGGLPRVLLVDDDSGVREVTAALLAELGCEVAEAGSGGMALDILERAAKPYDLAVLDFAMPGMNGAELARLLEARWPALPVLFVTGYADFAVFREMGEERIVQKPFRDDELQRKVRTALNRKTSENNVASLIPKSGAR